MARLGPNDFTALSRHDGFWLATWRAISPPRTPMSPRVASERRSRCCSLKSFLPDVSHELVAAKRYLDAGKVRLTYSANPALRKPSSR
jgi:hypothetical protein